VCIKKYILKIDTVMYVYVDQIYVYIYYDNHFMIMNELLASRSLPHSLHVLVCVCISIRMIVDTGTI